MDQLTPSNQKEQTRRLAESLKRQLGAFCPLLASPDLVELMLNADGTVFGLGYSQAYGRNAIYRCWPLVPTAGGNSTAGLAATVGSGRASGPASTALSRSLRSAMVVSSPQHGFDSGGRAPASMLHVSTSQVRDSARRSCPPPKIRRHTKLPPCAHHALALMGEETDQHLLARILSQARRRRRMAAPMVQSGTDRARSPAADRTKLGAHDARNGSALPDTRRRRRRA